MPKYRYIGNAPTVFISLIKNGMTWTASPEDNEIITTHGVAHPLLVEIQDSPIVSVVHEEEEQLSAEEDTADTNER